MDRFPFTSQRDVSRRAVLSGLVLLPVSRLLAQGEQQPSPTFSTDVKIVNVFATVRDKDGKVVSDLTRDDFALSEDGKPQKIQYFSRQSDLPLTLGLLVDTSMSERRMLSTERDASYSFLEKVLRPASDKAFLIHFDHDVELLQDLTSSRERLEKALALLDRPSWQDSNNSSGAGNNNGNANGGWGGHGGYGRHGGGSGSHGGGTAFYDSIYLAADDLMKKQTGRKALIMLTDGEDNASKTSLGEAIRTAQRADALGFAVRIADDEPSFNRGFGGPGMGRMGGGMGRGGGGPYGRSPGTERPDGKKVLQQISRETGGAYFEVSKKKSVDQIYSEIEDALRNQYSIGYTPDHAISEGGYRKIELTVKDRKYKVQARDGYYAEDRGKQS